MWFDGYTGQKRVIFDDFRPWWCEFSWLLRLLDRYPIQVPVKGGFVNFIPEELIITTNKNPEESFGIYRSNEDLQQLRRRLNRVVHFAKLSGPRLEPAVEVDTPMDLSAGAMRPGIDNSFSTSASSCALDFSYHRMQSESEPTD
nr:MAG: rep protein [Cressdnaviricota sp.]